MNIGNHRMSHDCGFATAATWLTSSGRREAQGVGWPLEGYR